MFTPETRTPDCESAPIAARPSAPATPIRPLTAALLALAVLGGVWSLHAQAVQRELYVSVLDEAGLPLTELQPSDVEVREDGNAREILSVRRADTPMQVALVVDNTQHASQDVANLRDGLKRFVDELAGPNSISIVTYADRPTILVDATADSAALAERGVNRLFSQPGSGSYLLDAILDVTRGFTRQEAARPAIVAVTTEGTEFSSAHHDQVIEALREAAVPLHVIVVQRPSTAAGFETQEERSRNIVLDRGTRESGGDRYIVLSSMAIPAELAKVASILAHQFVVVYARPESLIPPERVTVRATRPGVTARGVPVRSSN